MTGLPFRPGRLSIEGQRLVRAAVNPSDKPDHLQWVLNVVRAPEGGGLSAPFAIFADLHVVHQRHLVGVTFFSSVALPPKADPAKVDTEALQEVVSSIFGECLWDAASFAARQLAAMAALEGFVLAGKPPTSSSRNEILDDADQH